MAAQIETSGKQSGSSAKQTGENTGALTRARNFINDCIAELGKVTAPSRQESLQATMRVVVVILVSSFALALLDFIFRELIRFLI